MKTIDDYEPVEGDIEVGDTFIAFGKIDICTKVDTTHGRNYYGDNVKWTCGEDCTKLIKK